MARNKRGKMALYEAMSKARQKPGFGRTLERMREEKSHPYEPVEERPVEMVPAPEGFADDTPEPEVQWTRKPSIVQMNAGRIEFSMPYPIAVAMALGLLLVILLAFRVGQSYSPAQQGPAGPGQVSPKGPAERPQQDAGVPGQTGGQETTGNRDVGKAVTPASTGANAVVIVEYGRREDLVPVQKHFAEYGIATEIIAQGGRYFLVSRDRYDNISTAGSAGYEALVKIRRVGPEYRGKAPEGMETFAPNFFKDAYGKKVN